MKIAFVTDDGETTSAHFGRAIGYLVVTVDEGGTVSRERRPKPAHHSALGHPQREHGDGEHAGNGLGPAAGMLEPIRDCNLLVTRGMGRHAFEAARTAHLQPIITDIRSIDEALDAYLVGSLENHPERLH